MLANIVNETRLGRIKLGKLQKNRADTAVLVAEKHCHAIEW
jgi:hypothetical protein